jgi:hypothetical protein
MMAHLVIVEPAPKAKPWDKVSALHAGDRLSRVEFERRYAAHPEIKKAEPIDGVVFLPSPARFPEHAQPHGHMVTWIGVYSAATPGVLLGDNATVRLDPAAFWAGDMARVLAVLQENLGSPAHAAFVASLQARRPSPSV